MTGDTSSTETDRVVLDIDEAVQIADILEMHYESTKADAYEITADDAAELANAIRDRLPAFHQRFGPDYVCNIHGASFEPQELERNDGNCPWCGRSVDTEDDR